MNRIIEYTDIGVMPYREAWRLQDELRAARIDGSICDRLLLVEHPPVFTVGRRDCPEDFLSHPDAIAADGIEVVKTNRGGRVTWHGPGQLVGYFICGLEGLRVGIKDFVRAIEDICMGALADFGIEAERDAEHPGLWVGPDKIAAIGLNVSRGVTEHGFALNLSCDLAAYRHIVACGLKARGVTDVSRETGGGPSMAIAKASVIRHAGRVLAGEMVERSYQADVNLGPPICGVGSSTEISS
ncbi:MAG: lipoyl(octanoyl) transferase LipB [Pseudomonadota bacterium]